MEIIYFLAFVVVCACLVMWATGKSKKETELALRRQTKAKKARAELLETPAEYTLARPDQLWFTRKNKADLGVIPTNLFTPKSLAPEPEYDGYSRRDRHHVTDNNAHIKKESHIEKVTTGSAEFTGRAISH